MFGIDNNTTASSQVKLPGVSEGSEVTVLLTSIKETPKSLKGRFAIVEGKISQVHKGDMAVGQPVRVFMVRTDDTRRILGEPGMQGYKNYPQEEILQFLQTANGGEFPKGQVGDAVKMFCDNIKGVALKVISKREGNYPKSHYISVPNQDLVAQRKLLDTL